MKKKIVYIILFSATLLASSCKKFLATEPQDFVSPEQYYNTEAQLNTALVSVYDILGKSTLYGDALWEKFNVVNDECFFNKNNPTAISTGMRIHNTDASDPDIKSFWDVLYEGINRANLLLANINKPAMDATNRKVIEAEARFLRGYYYFLLVSNWGDVPLILTPTTSVVNTSVARTASAQVYEQILSDMQFAEANAKTITSLGYSGRISKTAAQGILARVCMYMAGYPLKNTAKYADALSWANKVILSGEHALNASYRQIFINYAQDLYDIKENLWEVEFWGNQVGNNYQEAGNLGYMNGITTSIASIGFSYGFINALPILYNKYAANDTLRRDWNIANFNYSAAGVKIAKASNDLFSRNTAKWRREYETLLPKAVNHTSQNFPIIRYSDVLLMKAEAENEINGPTVDAYDAINKVRARAYGKLVAGATNLTEANLPGLTQEAFRQQVRDERSRELCFEVLRKADLIRWGIYYTTMKDVANFVNTNATVNFTYAAIPGNNTTPRYVLLPIPQSDISVNPLLTQNAGW